MTLYGEREGAVRPVLQIAMPRPPRIYAPGGTMHVIQAWNLIHETADRVLNP
jgi:hypothetical protein